LKLPNEGSFTTLQRTNFIWLGADYSNAQNTTLINGSNTTFVYQNPSVIGVNQYLQLRFNASISQSINITEAGRYLLSFYYCKRVPNTSNQPTYIYFDNILIATLQSTIPETWELYSIEVNVKTRGSKTLKLQQPINISTYNIAFTKFSFVSFETFPECGTVYLPPLNFSDNKTFNPEDYDYQDQTLTIRAIDTRFLKNDRDQVLNGSLRLEGDVISSYFLSQPSGYFTGVESNLQSQLNSIKNSNVGGGFWSITAEGVLSTTTNSGYVFSFGQSQTNSILNTDRKSVV
jgi:hypothetical protein